MTFTLNDLTTLLDNSTIYNLEIKPEKITGSNNLIPVIASSDLISKNVIIDILQSGYRPILFDPVSIKLFPELVANLNFNSVIAEERFINELSNLNIKEKILIPEQLNQVEKFTPTDKLYFLTSGSTGKSKLIEKTVDNLLSEALVLKDLFDFKSNELILSSVPLCHIYGFLFSYLVPNITNSSVIHIENISQLISNLNKNNASVWITVPSVIDAVISLIEDNCNNSLRLIVSSGAKLSKESAEKISKLTKAKVIEVYGSTETGGIATLDTVNSDCYQILPQVTIKIDEMNKNIFVKSPFVSKNSIEQNNEIPLIDNQSYFKTNDIGYIENNNLFLEGRNDRIVKVRGKRVSLDLVENLLLKISCIKEVCLISHDNNGETVLTAFVKITEKNQLSQVKIEALDIIPDFMLPKHFIAVEQLPKFSNGKINYKLLKEQLIEART